MVLQIGDAGRPVGAAGDELAAAGDGERKVVAALLDADEAASDEVRRDAASATRPSSAARPPADASGRS